MILTDSFFIALASNIGDTEQLEKLQPLMHGQSHRVRLAETVQASGGQQYGEGYGKNAQSKPENNHPHPQSPRGRGGPAGRGMPSGRGGPFGRGAGIEAINRGRGR